ncbi:hypothetical protein DFP72DRAFT_1040504 [Ephemerocybe angulata]|uniref:Uncharacterized protein n=1 Tax=Ephemerocybe angulata TaxID=980116 RepID=A0A8H6MC36_9AGAR|nr:hypothetical protein DFP72DRAFT_1040504 [Tulosesus angulatus]
MDAATRSLARPFGVLALANSLDSLAGAHLRCARAREWRGTIDSNPRKSTSRDASDKRNQVDREVPKRAATEVMGRGDRTMHGNVRVMEESGDEYIRRGEMAVVRWRRSSLKEKRGGRNLAEPEDDLENISRSDIRRDGRMGRRANSIMTSHAEDILASITV